jgi:hypothetical protein
MENSAASSRTNLPIACTLSETEWAMRQQEIESMFKGSQQLNELSDGYALSYPGSEAWARKLFEFVMAERQCCPFLTFELFFESHSGPIWLRLRGAEGVKELFQHQLQGLAVRGN